MTYLRESASLTRLATGTISESTILGSTSYLVSNFTRQNDMPIAFEWIAWGNLVSDGIIEVSLSGEGGLDGQATGQLTFAYMTTQMLQYIFSQIMNSQYRKAVTLHVMHARLGMRTYNCYLEFKTGEDNFNTRQSAGLATNVVFNWDHGVQLGGGFSDGFSDGFRN